jgi:hypothetical protein
MKKLKNNKFFYPLLCIYLFQYYLKQSYPSVYPTFVNKRFYENRIMWPMWTIFGLIWLGHSVNFDKKASRLDFSNFDFGLTHK